MTLRGYLATMVASALLSGAAVVLIVTQTDPADAAHWVFGAFYISAFFALTSIFSVIGFLLRVAVLKHQPLQHSQHAMVSLRQAAILSALGVGCLALKGANIFTWWIGVALALFATILEFFFISAKIRQQ